MNTMNTKIIDKFIKNTLEVVNNHVEMGLSGEIEFYEAVGTKEITVYVERGMVHVYVHNHEGDEVTQRFANVIAYIKNALKNAVEDAEARVEADNNNWQDDYEVFGGYAMRGETISYRKVV